MKPAEWAKYGIEFHHTPMKDFFGMFIIDGIFSTFLVYT
jgi:hypothetical protein